MNIHIESNYHQRLTLTSERNSKYSSKILRWYHLTYKVIKLHFSKLTFVYEKSPPKYEFIHCAPSSNGSSFIHVHVTLLTNTLTSLEPYNEISCLTTTTMSGILLIQRIGLLHESISDITRGSSWGSHVHNGSNTHLKVKYSPKQMRETPHIHQKA